MTVHVSFGGHQLRELLESKTDKKITVYKLSKDIGVSYHTVTGLFSGMGRQINLDIVEKFLEYCTENDYDLTLSDMFTVEHID